jgi:hypothetical protein
LPIFTLGLLRVISEVVTYSWINRWVLLEFDFCDCSKLDFTLALKLPKEPETAASTLVSRKN